jgi:hypothetical protein
MTRKDYELIAAALKASSTPSIPLSDEEFAGFNFGFRQTVHAVALSLAETNPRFDKSRFEAACGITY